MPDSSVAPASEAGEPKTHAHDAAAAAAAAATAAIQQYPSPNTADSHDGPPFFSNNAASEDLGREHDQRSAQQDLQHHAGLGEPPAATSENHQDDRIPAAMTSAEELHLAAQLSQGMTQGIPGLLDGHEQSNLLPASQAENAADLVDGHVDQSQLGRTSQEPHQPSVGHTQSDSLSNQSGDAVGHDHYLADQPSQLHGRESPRQQLQELHQHDAEQFLAADDHQPVQPADDSHQFLTDEGHDTQHRQPPEPHHLAHEQHRFFPDPDQPQHESQQHPHHSIEHIQQQHHQHSQAAHPSYQSHMSHPESAMGQLAVAQQFATASAIVDAATPPRKRSKVSRACDECRRKKVKCDATASDNGDDNPCTNCRRSNMGCLFSRIPQKRGPSKGYIKELADRIHHIEGKLASDGGSNSLDSITELLGPPRRESSEVFGTPSAAGDEGNRKRPYSSISISNDLGTPPVSSRAANNSWAADTRPIQPSYQGPKGSPYTGQGLAPQPLAKPDADTSSRASAADIDTLPLNLNPHENIHEGPACELEGDAVNGYLNVVHPCYPLLASSKERIEAQLSQCPVLLRDAFVEAFYVTMQSSLSAPGLYTSGDVSSAARMITSWESDSAPRMPIADLVHLQTLILIAIATDTYGPPSLKGEHGGASKASVLGRAVGLAYSMRLHMSGMNASPDLEPDTDSYSNMTVRAWWTLVMLDRWNAIGTASPLFIPNDSVVVVPSLNALLGDGVYHLARLSNILGHFAPVALAPPQALAPGTGVAPILNSFFNLSIELFREQLPATLTPTSHPILHLVYWHCRLVAYLFQTNAKTSDVLWPCKETAGLLLTNTQLLSPLNHHFFCLTALCLLELSKIEGTREEANVHLRELSESNLAPSTWDTFIQNRIADTMRPSTTQTVASQNLQHLADLAMATTDGESVKAEKGVHAPPAMSLRTSDNYDDMGFDPRPLTRSGYLNVLGGTHFTGATQ